MSWANWRASPRCSAGSYNAVRARGAATQPGSPGAFNRGRATGERVDGWTVTAPEAPTTIPSRLPTRGVVCAAWRPGHPGGGRPSAPTSLHPLREAARAPHACRESSERPPLPSTRRRRRLSSGWTPTQRPDGPRLSPLRAERLECPIQGLAPSRAAAAMVSPPPTEAWSPSSPSSRSP